MDRQLELICKSRTGMDKVNEIHTWFDAKCYMRPSEDEKDDLLREVLSASALAFCENAIYEGYSAEKIEDTVVKKSIESIEVYDAPFEIMGLLIAYTGNKELSDKTILLWDKYAESKKVQAAIKSVLNCLDQLKGKRKSYNNGIVFKMSYIFLSHGRRDEAEYLEKNSVGSIVYDFSKMHNVDEKITRDYYAYVKDDDRLFGFFVRKLKDFREYEKYLGVTGEEIIRHGLEDFNSPEISYRILRGLYAERDVCDSWYFTVRDSAAGEKVKNWCHLYYLLTMMKLSLKDYSGEEDFWRDNDENINLMPLIDYNDAGNYVNKPIFELACIFNHFILNDWNVHRFIERLGEKNACLLENGKNFSGELNDIKDVCYQAAQKVFNEIQDPDELLFLYMSTHLKLVFPLRDIVERIAELTDGKIGPVFEKYRFYGKVCRISDKVQELQGRYTVEVLSACVRDGYRWKDIHKLANNGTIEERERNRRCRLLLVNEEEVVTKNRQGYEKDCKVSFIVKNCIKTGVSFEDCTILIGDFNLEEEGKKIPLSLALDEAEKWLENIIEKKQVDDLDSKVRNALDEPKKDKRSDQFSWLILNAFYAMSSEAEFELFASLMSGSAYDPINEFYYKPGRGVIDVTLKHDKESRDEIRKIGRNIAKSSIAPSRKMYIYMNTCLQTYMYLEDFVSLSMKASGISLSELMIYKREYEIDTYLFHIFPIKNLADKYIFRFYNRKDKKEYPYINAKYGRNLVIEKSKLTEEICHMIENGNKQELYAAIAEIDDNSGEIRLKNAYSRSEIKNDSWLLFNRCLFDAKKTSDYNEMVPKIAEMKNYHINFEVGKRYELFIGNLGSYMKRMNYDTDKCYYFFMEWDNDAPMSDENLALTHKNLEEKVSEQVVHLVRGMSEKGQAMRLKRIYELSYMKFFVTREEFEKQINNQIVHCK